MGDFPPEITERQVGSPEQNGQVGEWPPRWTSIVIVDYDPVWPQRYATGSAGIRAALGDRLLSIEHVGSTSVPGLAAKPIVDIDVILAGTEDESAYVPALEATGYRLILREPWWQGHRMLVDPDEDFHVHVWPRDAAEPTRHRLFRDWLRAHPDDRELYATTKRRLAAEAGDDYTMSKSDVIDQIFARIFAATSPPSPDTA
ncbi:GrpB family protein [Actinoplanes bogorensis]|uniref:GrpB family protein n=1 Tax=Paractinoplanes bogorensis TaxID=1610840 RepID=A0ABS5YZY1_9ACTN|nr:GrpB family protein [Actinoplanes bogorensis]MBU2669009.1 GrpB family protein [Actinoplanes bogorensis]